MLRKYYTRLLQAFIALLLIFLALFIVSFIDLKRGISIIDVGMPGLTETYVVMILSILGIAKTVWEMHRLEHPSRIARTVIKPSS